MVSEWTRETFDKAVREIVELGLIDGALVEARPFWNVPNSVVIGQVRESNDPAIFFWIIAVEGVTDYVGSAAAATPREAARHFSLKWQLDASHSDDTLFADRLVTRAEELYDMVENESLWQQPG